MKTVKLITCDEAFQAITFKVLWKMMGIASVLHNENTSTVLRGYTREIAGVDVLVYEDDYDRAGIPARAKSDDPRAIEVLSSLRFVQD